MRLVLGWLLLAGGPTVAAEPCAPIDDAGLLIACPAGGAEGEAARIGRALAVTPTDAPLADYERVVLKLSRAVKMTPLLFPGAPRGAAEGTSGAGEGGSAGAAGGDKLARRRAETLTNGYLWTLDGKTARGWHTRLDLGALFDAPTLVLMRGDRPFPLVRRAGRYEHAEGAITGSRARLLLFDRVAETREELGPPSAFDLDLLREGLAIRRFDVDSVDPSRARVRARFVSGLVVPGIVVHDGERTRLVVQGDRAALTGAVADGRRTMEVERAILGAADIMEAERLKFDEPVIEIDQQDGAVRRAWWRAYAGDRDHYVINGHRYDVFDGQGRPYVPQVCVDFLVDAIDRSGGSWYGRRTEPRVRKPGLVDLRALATEQGYDLRLVPHLVRMARQHPEMWDIYTVPKDERVPFRKRDAFHEKMRTFPVELREADIIVIWGKRADERNHFHSFFVHRTDPILGYPIVFSENAGYARVRVLDEIMRAAPRRSFLHRLRLRTDWVLERREERRRQLEAESN